MEVAFEPYKKITFRSYQKYESAEQLANAITLGAPVGALFQNLLWAEGVVFRFAGLAATDSFIKSVIDGYLYWDHVEFAPMPTYSREIRATERAAMLHVLDVSNHIVFREVAKALKQLSEIK